MWILLILISAQSLSTQLEGVVECESCRATILALQELYKDPSRWEKANKIAIDYCVATGNYIRTVCEGAVMENSPIAIDSLINRFLDPDRTCKELGYCTTPSYVDENFTTWVSNVMKSKPVGPSPVPSGKSTYTFVQMSDIHIDLYYQPGTVTDCDEPVCCRTGTGNAGVWGDYNCDLPPKTFQAALEQIQQLSPDFIIITGDMPPHDIWNQSDSYNMGYQTITSSLMKQYFPNTPVYSIFGNHACFPVNQYSFELGKEDWLKNGFADNWGHWLDDAAIKSLRERGTYSMLHPGTNLRMVALNTQACNNQNFYLWVNSTDPDGQIVWLWQTLLQAEQNKEVVYLYGHYYLADDGCLKYWSYHINALIDRFQNTVAGTFFGHSHEDTFHINRGVYTNLPTNVQFVAPSITTYTDKNPSFRVYVADSDSKQVVDYSQYRLNLPNANLNPTTTPTFDLAYTFKAQYGMNDMLLSSMYSLALQIGHNQQLAITYLTNKQTGVDPPTSCDTNCLQSLLCDLTYGVGDQIDQCTSGPPPDTWQNQINDILFPPWVYKVK